MAKTLYNLIIDSIKGRFLRDVESNNIYLYEGITGTTEDKGAFLFLIEITPSIATSRAVSFFDLNRYEEVSVEEAKKINPNLGELLLNYMGNFPEDHFDSHQLNIPPSVFPVRTKQT